MPKWYGNVQLLYESHSEIATDLIFKEFVDPPIIALDSTTLDLGEIVTPQSVRSVKELSTTTLEIDETFPHLQQATASRYGRYFNITSSWHLNSKRDQYFYSS